MSSRRLKEEFTRVLYTHSEGEILLQKLGRLSATILEKLVVYVQKDKSEKPHISREITLGVSFGIQLRYIVDFAYPERTSKNLMVIPLVGGIATDEENLKNESNELARRISKHYRGHWKHLLCPARVDSTEAKKTFESQTLIADVIQQGCNADIYLLGIGSSHPDPEFSSKLQAGLVTEILLKQMEKVHNAVGFICARMYDDKGNHCPYPENFGAIIGASIDDLKESVENGNYSLAVAGGEKYYNAVHGALLTGCINCLVTDQRCAGWVIKAEEERREKEENNLKVSS